jgi:hypothetical protein
MPPLFSDLYYYFPQGAHGIFSARKAIFQVYSGWLLIIDQEQNQEVRRIQLSPNNKYSSAIGMMAVTNYNGQKVSWKDSSMTFYGYNPRLHMLLSPILCSLIWGSKARKLKQAILSATV